jgi:hypothetical protein
LQLAKLPLDFLGMMLIVPEIWLQRLRLQPLNVELLVIYVKDAPSGPAFCLSAPEFFAALLLFR